jgi:predicted NUDIX family NTP pyrophosphohydrolase
MEWPPKSGTMKTFAEVDKAGWFSINDAKEKINPAQSSFIDQVIALKG